MAKEQSVSLRPLTIQRMVLTIVGTSPYLPEPLDISIAETLDKKRSNQVTEKDKSSEEEKAKKKFYYTESGDYGMPARAIYRSWERGASYVIEKRDGGMSRFIRGVNILGDILPIQYEDIKQLRHVGRDSSTNGKKGAPRLIIRNAFYGWSVDVEVEFDPNDISAEQIVNIAQHAGFHEGVGGFRRGCKGNFGMYIVQTKQ